MRALVGSLLLGGAVLQGIAHFVPSHGYKIWTYTHSSFQGFVFNGDYVLLVILLAIAGVIVLAAGSREVAAFATGVAVLGVIVWVQIGFAPWLQHSGSYSVYWNGIIGLVGALAAGAGGVMGWAAGFDETQTHRRVAPGWYSDPTGPGLRWWDGATWTTHTSA
jgi:hypothetical protein